MDTAQPVELSDSYLATQEESRLNPPDADAVAPDGPQEIEGHHRRCCELDRNHPLWRETRLAMMHPSGRARADAIKTAVARHPVLTADEVRRHLHWHRAPAPDSSSQTHHLIEHVAITDGELALLACNARVGLLTIPAAADLTGRSQDAAAKALRRMLMEQLVVAVPLKFGRGTRGDRRRRVGYLVSPLGRRVLIRDAEDETDVLVLNVKVISRAQDVGQLQLHHDATAIELTASLCAHAKAESARVQQQGDQERRLEITVAPASVLGPRQLMAAFQGPGWQDGPASYNTSAQRLKMPDAGVALGLHEDGGIDVSLPLLIEYDSGDKTVSNVAEQVWEYVLLSHAQGLPAAADRWPQLGAVAEAGYCTPVLFACDVARLPASTDDERARRQRRLVARIERVVTKSQELARGRRITGASHALPPIFFCRVDELLELGWDVLVQDWREAEDAPRKPLWSAIVSVAGPWLDAWPVRADQELDLNPDPAVKRLYLTGGAQGLTAAGTAQKRAVSEERNQKLRELGFDVDVPPAPVLSADPEPGGRA